MTPPIPSRDDTMANVQPVYVCATLSQSSIWLHKQHIVAQKTIPIFGHFEKIDLP